MDVKRYINTRIWSDTWFEELDSTERLVWLYLLTNQQTNLIGIYEIGLKRISNESGVEINRLQTVMERFANRSKAFHNGCFVIIPNYLRNQNLANPNMEKSARNLFDSLPQEVKKALQLIGINDFEILKKGLPNRLQTVTKPFANPFIREREREREKEKEREGESKGDGDPIGSPADLEKNLFDHHRNMIVEDFPKSQDQEEEEPPTNETDEDQKDSEDYKKQKRMTQMQMLEFLELPHDTPEFREAWETWIRYKTLIKDPYKAPATMQAALKKFASYPAEQGINAIHDSISNQWKGVFPEKSKYHERNQNNFQQPSGQAGGISRLYQKLVESRGVGEHL